MKTLVLTLILFILFSLLVFAPPVSAAPPAPEPVPTHVLGPSADTPVLVLMPVFLTNIKANRVFPPYVHPSDGWLFVGEYIDVFSECMGYMTVEPVGISDFLAVPNAVPAYGLCHWKLYLNEPGFVTAVQGIAMDRFNMGINAVMWKTNVDLMVRP